MRDRERRPDRSIICSSQKDYDIITIKKLLPIFPSLDEMGVCCGRQKGISPILGLTADEIVSLINSLDILFFLIKDIKIAALLQA